MLNCVGKFDVLIVGAGFGGIYQLKHFRQLGYKTKLLESGSDYGGVWHWNRYPGARTDSSIPHYEFDDPALWSTWTWKQRYPDSCELRAYFQHVARVWDLEKDTQFNTFVDSANWDDLQCLWTIHTQQRECYTARYLLLNVGFAAKRYIPNWDGIETFKGTFIHPSYWPRDGLDLKGKRVAVIGTGATGVQLATELSSIAGELVIFQRTPNTALPLKQVNYQDDKQAIGREAYPDLFKGRPLSFSGFSFSPVGRNTFDDTPEQRQTFYESLWEEGGFKFWLANYQDMLRVKAASDEAYAFWREKTRARIHDPRVRDLLAPMAAPYSFGCKRVPLEQGFFEIFDKSHVYIVDVNSTPIEAIIDKGIRTTEKVWEFDYIICATGFDSATGGLEQIDIKNTSGETLAEYWRNGTRTYLGMAVAGFPNLFFTYGPQAPTALCNGPTCAQIQGDWIVGLISRMESAGERKVVVEKAYEEDWRRTILDLASLTLVPGTKSWYMGDNIPEKRREPLFYLGGVPNYYAKLNEVAANGYPGFNFI